MSMQTTYESPVGRLWLATDARGDNVTGLWLEGQKYFGSPDLDDGEPNGDAPALTIAREWLDRYFAGDKPDPHEVPCAAPGSEFQHLIWDLLCDIPFGGVTTYGRLAREAAARMGRPTMSSQAVGGAVGRNPVSIIVPCHRVVGANGSLTGYAGGSDRKIALLKLEGVDMSGLYRPARSTAP